MSDSTGPLRAAVSTALERRETHRAIQAARALLAGSPGARQWAFLRRAAEGVPAEALGLRTIRVALLSSFSIEFAHDPLIAQGFLNELRVEIYQPGFAQFRQEILDPSSGLYASRPDIVILALEGKHVFPFAYGDYGRHMGTGLDGLLEQAERELDDLLTAFRSHSDAMLLVHSFAPPRWRQLGVLDGHVGLGQAQAVQALNDALYRAAKARRGVYVVDYAGLVNRIGADQWYDDRMDHYAQAPIAQAALPLLTAEYMKFARALAGKSRKCVVVDLDNTIWGGVVGEAGPHGIAVGPEYPGSAFVAFQRALLDLSRRGILLAVASKNNEADVQEAFATNPHMVLAAEHFAHMEVHWGPKDRSLAAIAARLNIGMEHLVFVDDSPVECELVRAACPMVTVIELPKQPERYVRALLEEGLFDGLSYSEEDSRRLELYRQRAQAEEMLSQSGSLDEVLRNLGTEVTVAPVDESSLARAAQLTQKTNQFNTTTRRYTEADVSRRRGDSDWLATTVRVRDRFGDHGIVGVMLAHRDGDALEVDSFLLSCRVIGRKVETVMLAALCDEAQSRGLGRLRGEIVVTKKNEPARDLYQRHGFRRVGGDGAHEGVWEIDLTQGRVEYPDAVVVVSSTAGPRA
jgi:FkbH-like protein